MKKKTIHMSLMLILGTVIVAPGCGTEADVAHDDRSDSTGEEVAKKKDKEYTAKQMTLSKVMTLLPKCVLNTNWNQSRCNFVSQEVQRQFYRFNRNAWKRRKNSSKFVAYAEQHEFTGLSPADEKLVDIFDKMSDDRQKIFWRKINFALRDSGMACDRTFPGPPLLLCGKKIRTCKTRVARMNKQNCILELATQARILGGTSRWKAQ